MTAVRRGATAQADTAFLCSRPGVRVLVEPGGPEDPATVYLRLVTERIELWSAVHGVMPEPIGYSAAALSRDGEAWRVSAT